MAFNILDRNHLLHRNAFLEASAGTGKTFTIENIVVRLLLEEPPFTLEKILIVTFTRAATRDLKERVRGNLEKCLELLKVNSLAEIPDYVAAILEKGEEEGRKAIKRIEIALHSFDQAQIFTMHGFCWRMLKNHALEGGISVETASSEENTLTTTKLLQAIRDFLRTELEEFSQEQLKILVKRIGGDIDKLQQELLQIANRGIEILSPPSYRELFEQFSCSMAKLQVHHLLNSEKILDDFYSLVPAFKGLCDKNKQVHPSAVEKVQRFAKLFDKRQWTTEDFEILIADGLFWLEAFDAENLSKKATLPSFLNYPDLFSLLQCELSPIVSQGRNPIFIFARLASDCQKFLRRFQEAEEMVGHSDLLLQMRRAVADEAFKKKVRGNYSAVIVDEFQDTDPHQWAIFSQLFNPKQGWEGFLYLVGDPKQSIYAFRQADIYTYLEAARSLESDSFATLDTNYRSQPILVEALNVLFGAADGLFPLPGENDNLSFRPVKAGKAENRDFSDGKPGVVFWEIKGDKKYSLKAYEERYFFPAIARELVRLNAEDQISFHQCAVLVADRFQATRLSDYLKQAGIPTRKQRSQPLSQSSALEAMREVLQGILNYRDDSLLKIALAGCVIGMNLDELKLLKAEAKYQQLIEFIDPLRRHLIEGGFGAFYPRFMQAVWHPDGKSVLERMLQREAGEEFYREWQDIADLLIEEEAHQRLSAGGLVAFLDQFAALANNDEERLKGYMDPEQEGVFILTTHVSKGLEFDVVFTLGLINRTKQSIDRPILLTHKDKQYLGAAIDSNDPNYLKHCEESDAEKMRQLYVALTRAKLRVYIPMVFPESGVSIDMGTASPMELLLSRFGAAHLDYRGLYERLTHYDISAFEKVIEENKGLICCKSLPDSNLPEKHKNISDSPQLVQPPAITINKNPQFIHSFTSLTQGSESPENELPQNLEILIETKNDQSMPHEFLVESMNAHTLPAGNETGILLHKLLENLTFSRVKEFESSDDLIPWMRHYIQNSPFERWEKVIAHMIYTTLTTPLPHSTPSFCLADLSPRKIYRETEFLYSASDSEMFKGVIDLLFEYEGKYYLLDWKSNWLGPSQEYYSQDGMSQAMRVHQYGLQAKIYVEALQRYLKIFHQGPFEDMFGGVYYIFLRGVGPNTGIWKG